MYFIGYDIGSSSVKASLLDAHTNQTIASAQYPKQEMGMIAHHPGWAEQHPEDWWDAIKRVTAELLDTHVSKDDIKAIGISYQMHGLVVVDKDHRVLRPSIIWCDSRAVEIGDKAYDQLGHSYCQTNLLNSPGNFTASKLAWVKQHEPELYAKIHKFMLPGDYLAMKLSGTINSTISGLSEGIFYDFVEDEISDRVLSNYGIDRSLVPDVVPTFGLQSVVSAAAAAELGLAAGTKITYRAGDQPNNALSLNVLNPGELAATAGTSGVVYGVTDSLNGDPLSRVNSFAHVNHSSESRRIGVLLCINGTGIMYSWAHKNLAVDTYPEMNDLASEVEVGAEGLVILPFGNGAERILQNKNIGAQVKGLELNIHNRKHMLRAITEGIACSMRYGTDIMKEMGISPQVIRAGYANLYQSELYRKAVANLVGATIQLYNTDGAAGAARGAGIGLGHYSEKDAFGGLELITEIHPDQDQARYEEVYGNWKQALDKTLA